MAVLSVLNKKCGRMRDCNSASRAVVAAGVRPRTRHTSPASRPAASSAPVQALASQGGVSLNPSKVSMPHAYTPASAPSTTPVAICSDSGRRASRRLKLQPSTSHSSVAGSAPPVTTATRPSQSAVPLATYIRPMAITASTYSTARRITPTWQASNTSTGAGARGTGGGSLRSAKVDRISESFMGLMRSSAV